MPFISLTRGASLAVLLGVIAATAVPAPVQAAGKPSAADRKAITACLDKAEREFRSALPCVGLLANRCLREIKVGDYADACAKRELVVWAERLERAWTRFEASVPAEEHTNQIKAQEVWFTYRNAFCPVRGKLDPGYVLGGADYCLMRETGVRAIAV